MVTKHQEPLNLFLINRSFIDKSHQAMMIQIKLNVNYTIRYMILIIQWLAFGSLSFISFICLQFLLFFYFLSQCLLFCGIYVGFNNDLSNVDVALTVSCIRKDSIVFCNSSVDEARACFNLVVVSYDTCLSAFCSNLACV